MSGLGMSDFRHNAANQVTRKEAQLNFYFRGGDDPNSDPSPSPNPNPNPDPDPDPMGDI